MDSARNKKMLNFFLTNFHCITESLYLMFRNTMNYYLYKNLQRMLAGLAKIKFKGWATSLMMKVNNVILKNGAAQ